MANIGKRLAVLALAALIGAPGAAQEEAAEEDEGLPAAEADGGEEAPPPLRKKSRRPRVAKPEAQPDSLKARLAEISRVYKAQIEFGASEFAIWKNFWTKLRDDRGLFEMRLIKQREGFVDSLRSLASRDHGQSLLDFETMQNNVMKSFEQDQSSRIKEFIAERASRLQEFGARQEEERIRLAQESSFNWDSEKSALNIEVVPPPPPLPPEDEKGKKKKKR